jgi:hypothetical protein
VPARLVAAGELQRFAPRVGACSHHNDAVINLTERCD